MKCDANSSSLYKYFVYPLVIMPLYVIWKIFYKLIKIDKTSIIASIIIFPIITFIYPIHYVPSPSMVDTLVNRDFILASKIEYGYKDKSFWGASYIRNILPLQGRPIARGDVVIFYPPDISIPDPFIKRVIGVPGDELVIHKGRIYVNDILVPLKLIQENVYFSEQETGAKAITGNIFEEMLPACTPHRIVKHLSIQDNPFDFYVHELRIKVPSKHYFLMGDNRDSSQDSRSIFIDPHNTSGVSFGLVPEENIIAKALAIIFSTRSRWYQPWLYWDIRWNRIGWIR